MYCDARELLSILRPMFRHQASGLQLDDESLAGLATKLIAGASGGQLYETARAIVICGEAMSGISGAERFSLDGKEPIPAAR